MATVRDVLMNKVVRLQEDYGNALMEQSPALDLGNATEAAATLTLAHVLLGLDKTLVQRIERELHPDESEGG
jgi:hypothetical protein